MKPKFKIAIYSGTIPSTSFVERLITGISKDHNVLVFGKMDKSYTYTSKNIQIYHTPKSKWKNSLLSIWRTVLLLFSRPKALNLLCKAIQNETSLYVKFDLYTRFLPIILHKPDVFHIQWTKDLPRFSILKTQFNIPLIVSLRGAHINYTPIVEPKYVALYQHTFPLADAFHGVSKTIIKEALNYGDIENRSTVIYSPIPDVFFQKYKPFKKKDKNEIHLVSVGRNHWKKGYHYMLDALHQLKEKGYKITYTLIGQDVAPESLLVQIVQLGLTDVVKFKDKMSQEELLSVYQTHDVLVLPSLEEGIANVVLEAMAVGLPVVSTDCGGMAEVVKNKETGWLVPTRNPEAIANAIIDCHQTSDEDVNRITLNAHNLIKQKSNYNTNMTKFVKLYEEL